MFPVSVVQLSDPQDIDGAAASAQSDAVDGEVIRIVAVNADIRFVIGDNPVALTTSHYLALGSEIYLPIKPGQKVAVLGGTAHIATCGS